MRVRLGARGRRLGEIEEYFVVGLTPGDTFVFAGRLLRFEGVRENEVIATVAKDGGDPKVPAYAGGRLPLTSELAHRVRALLADPRHWSVLPTPVREWLERQEARSVLVSPGRAAGRELRPRWPALSRRLLLCRPERTPDAGHAADPAAPARGQAAAGLRRLGLLHCRLGARAGRRRGRPFRRRHAGRRSRGVDGREQHAQADLPQLRRRGGPDRAPLSGAGEDGPAGDLQRGPDLRRAAEVRARSRAAPGGARRGGHRASPISAVLAIS